MGGVASKNASGQWPPRYEDLTQHWCLSFEKDFETLFLHSVRQEHDTVITCKDVQLERQQEHAEFDYSQFCCAKASCQVCLDLNTDFFPSRDLNVGTVYNEKDPLSKDIHFTFKALLDSVENGACRYCSILAEGLKGLSDEKSQLQPTSVLCLELREDYTVRIIQEKENDNEASLCVEYYSHAGEPTPWLVFGAAGTMKSKLTIPDYVSFIKNCMLKCHDHEECNAHHALITPKLPARLIDVGSGENDIRLEECPKVGEKYTTLSHCWGRQQIAQTLTTNLQHLSKNIPWVMLSKTFQDAINVTRGLGLRYIWIDSLCIIQDSNADWQHEATCMADIYTNSYLTLAATSSLESSGGLLNPRYIVDNDETVYSHTEIEINRLSDNGDSVVVYARRCITSSHDNLLLQKTLIADRIISAPLLSRAWALQERLLSLRTIHFCFDELVWECKTQADCECGYALSNSGKLEAESEIGESRFIKLFNKKQLQARMKEQGTTDENQRLEAELICAWYRLVEYYTTLDLTFPSDRLPALRGLAGFVAENMGWKINFGIYEHDIVRGLLWKRNFSPTKRRTDAGTPSWSWVAVESGGLTRPSYKWSLPPNSRPIREISGLVEHHGDYESWSADERFEVVATSADIWKTQYEDKDFIHNYKDLVPGNEPFLVLKGAMVDAKAGKEDSPDVVNEELRLFTCDKNEKLQVTWDVESDDKKYEVEAGDELSCMLLSKSASESEPKDDGIVLQKNSSGSYTRRGYFDYKQKQGSMLFGFFEGNLFKGARVQEVVLV